MIELPDPRCVHHLGQTLTFRIAITAALMGFLVALGACLIFIQIATFHAAAEAAASAAIDAASAYSISSPVRVLSTNPSLADTDQRSEADGAIVVFKAALQELPQTDSPYVGYDNGCWLQVKLGALIKGRGVLQPFFVRLGIHGGRRDRNMGSSDRLEYTALRNSVNLAARLEGFNKEYKTTILVSGYCRSRPRAPVEKTKAFVETLGTKTARIWAICWIGPRMPRNATSTMLRSRTHSPVS